MTTHLVVSGVSKSFIINGSFFEKFLPFSSKKTKGFKALHDFSYDFEYGKKYGIIGLNGSGKSTLLQIITGTLTPDKGYVKRPDNVHALLELGSGFNPEFSGLENAKLTASLFEKNNKFLSQYLKEVESFADIGKFFYSPVRTYSSGMLARVAFSVHANLQPDVFIIDEAIAVGDLPFQTKCFKYIKELSLTGTTIIFVSHDIPLVQSYCDEVLYLDSGKLVDSGDPSKVCNHFVNKAMLGSEKPAPLISDSRHNGGMRSGNGKARIKSVSFENKQSPFEFGSIVMLKIRISSFSFLEKLDFGITVFDKIGNSVCYTDSRIENKTIYNLKDKGHVDMKFSFKCIFTRGYYTLCFVLSEGDAKHTDTIDYYPDALGFEVLENEFRIYATTKLESEIELIE